jgi:hypothetical protein
MCFSLSLSLSLSLSRSKLIQTTKQFQKEMILQESEDFTLSRIPSAGVIEKKWRRVILTGFFIVNLRGARTCFEI